MFGSMNSDLEIVNSKNYNWEIITYPLSNGPPWGIKGAGTGTYGPAWWTCLWGTVIKASDIFPNTRYNTQKITIVVNFMVFGGQHPTTNSNELQLSAHSLYIPIPYNISLNAMMVWYWYKGPPMTIGLPYSIYICCHVSQWIEDEKKNGCNYFCVVSLWFSGY